MRKVSISLEKGKKYKKVGLAIYEYEGEEELRKVITLIEECLRKNFSNVEIKKQRATRILFGEEL